MVGRTPRLSLIFVLLALTGFILLMTNITSLESLYDRITARFYKIQNSVQLKFKPQIAGSLEVNDTNCEQFGKKPTEEEAIEERRLLHSLAWPGPPVQGLPVEFSSSPAKSYFVIQGPEKQHVGDQLVVNVHVQNYKGLPKTHGGDFLIARLHTPELGAGVAGKVTDHHDGNYTVLFPLLWPGVVRVAITMVHPSEAVAVLQDLHVKNPDRVIFQSLFRAGNVSEATDCDMCLPLNQKPLCNYTDPITGEPWHCYKPKDLECDTRTNHYRKGYKTNIITENEAELLKNGVNIKMPIPAAALDHVTVLPAGNNQTEVKSIYSFSGYYFNGIWRPLNGAVVQQFDDSSAVVNCLKGKLLYMFGDSTMRQWFEYLTATLPNLKQISLYSSKFLGPFMAVDSSNNILVSFHGHGPPIRTVSVYPTGMTYVANELDRTNGGSNTVVLISVWAHFSTYPIQVYIRRIRHIRSAVLRMLKREPSTLVVIRTPNLQWFNQMYSPSNSDWFSLQIDIVLRAMFKGLNVKMVDAWEMVLAHHLPHDIHPPKPIIKNMIHLILSNICPKEKI